MIAITKVDLVRPDSLQSLRNQLTQISPGVPTVLADDPNLPALLLRIGGRRPGSTVALPAPTLFDRHIVTTVPLPNPIEREEIEALIDRLPDNVMRAKGIAADANGRRWAIQVVGRRRAITELADVESESPTDLVTIAIRPADR